MKEVLSVRVTEKQTKIIEEIGGARFLIEIVEYLYDSKPMTLAKLVCDKVANDTKTKIRLIKKNGGRNDKGRAGTEGRD